MVVRDHVILWKNLVTINLIFIAIIQPHYSSENFSQCLVLNSWAYLRHIMHVYLQCQQILPYNMCKVVMKAYTYCSAFDYLLFSVLYNNKAHLFFGYIILPYHCY